VSLILILRSKNLGSVSAEIYYLTMKENASFVKEKPEG
jgi:hypothetical protein